MTTGEDKILRLGQWRILASEIAALEVLRAKDNRISMTIHLKAGKEIKQFGADFNEAKTLVENWGAYNGVKESLKGVK